MLGALCQCFSNCDRDTDHLGILLKGRICFSMSDDAGRTLGFKVDGQERILEISFMQKGVFIKVQGQDTWAERDALGLCGAAHCML